MMIAASPLQSQCRHHCGCEMVCSVVMEGVTEERPDLLDLLDLLDLPDHLDHKVRPDLEVWFPVQQVRKDLLVLWVRKIALDLLGWPGSSRSMGHQDKEVDQGLSR